MSTVLERFVLISSLFHGPEQTRYISEAAILTELQ